MQVNTQDIVLPIHEAFTLVGKHILGAWASNKTPFRAPGNVMLHGTYGVGKSAGTENLIDVLKEEPRLKRRYNGEIYLIDVRVGAMQSSDIQGIPHTAETGEHYVVTITNEKGEQEVRHVPKKDMFFSTPPWWPKDANDDDGRPHSEKPLYILFLDELKNAKNAEQHAAYRILQERTCQNGKKLGKNVFIMGAGNIASDNTGARELLPAAANRFALHIFIDSTSEDAVSSFIIHAAENGIREEISAFLLKSPEFLAKDATPGQNSIPRPRTWYRVSEAMDNEFFTSEQRLKAIQACVGKSAANMLQAFIDIGKDLPDYDAICNGENAPESTGNLDLTFFIVITVASYINREVEKLNDKKYTREEFTTRMTRLITWLTGPSHQCLHEENPILQVDHVLPCIRIFKNSPKFARNLPVMMGVPPLKAMMDIGLQRVKNNM